MSQEIKNNWDRERVVAILTDLLEGEEIPSDEACHNLVELLSSVRAETLGWTLAWACSQYDQGRDPRRQNIAPLLLQAIEDLNPSRE